MKYIKLFDKQIPLKNTSCLYNDEKETEELLPYTNLFIRITDNCQANCGFCEFHYNETLYFDLQKLFSVIKELKNQGIWINKINFTGGEPMLYPDLVERIVSFVKEEKLGSQLIINTNGINFEKLDKIKDRLTSVSLSRHHYDDEKNFEIFKTDKLITKKQIDKNNFKDIFHLRCNLIKGYIDTQEEVIKYIETFAKHNYYFGFVSLMKINKFCEENYIDYKKLDLDNLPNSRIVYKQRRIENGIKICDCKNIVHYTNSGELVKLYSRANYVTDNYDSMLVFDKDVLKLGFSNEVII